MKSYSQCKQDKCINILFKGKKNGVFLDIGAHDGISLSNTYFFEKEKKWTGICIEPNPEIFKELQLNRTCILENCCISDNESQVIFRKVNGPGNMLSGILDFFDAKHIARIEQWINVSGGDYEDIAINCKTIETILSKYDITEIDYCSIDTEGAELQIIKSIDLDKFSIKSFSVENNNRDKIVRNYLKQKGYYCIPSVQDDFYVKRFSIKCIPLMVYTTWYYFCTGMRSVSRRLKSKIFGSAKSV